MNRLEQEERERRITPGNRAFGVFCVISARIGMERAPKIVASVMLLAALLPWPYGYYVLLRWVVCGVCAWSAYSAAQSQKVSWAWALGIIAVMFNPIFPIYLNRAVWTLIDIVAAAVLLCSIQHARPGETINELKLRS